ncbi:hypothetical protein JXD38_00980 [candidate division WOR-3 bacterium]|nr:hypothetical protein [candidate division WOR-3 bacterium]
MRILIAGFVMISCWVTCMHGEPAMKLFDGKLGFDAQVWGTARFYRFTSVGVSSNDARFERTTALAGLTGRVSSVASIRAFFDIGRYWGGSALDMYVDLAWQNGFGLRIGQFLLPLGFDYMTDYVRQPLVNNSLLQSYAKANGGRDIGATGSWQNGRFSVTTAVINGAGANADDNDARKDVCARFTAKPFGALDAVVALRGYYGWPGWSDTAWSSVAAEARFRSGSLELQAEIQNHSGDDGRNNAAYLQAAWGLGLFEPAARFDLVLPRGRRSEWMLTAGLNLRPIPEHLRVMLDCSYRRNYQDNWSVLAFMLRVQAWL